MSTSSARRRWWTWSCIVFVRDKVPTKEIIDMARENDMVLMTTWHTLYCTSGILYSNGLTGIGRRQ